MSFALAFKFHMEIHSKLRFESHAHFTVCKVCLVAVSDAGVCQLRGLMLLFWSCWSFFRYRYVPMTAMNRLLECHLCRLRLHRHRRRCAHRHHRSVFYFFVCLIFLPIFIHISWDENKCLYTFLASFFCPVHVCQEKYRVLRSCVAFPLVAWIYIFNTSIQRCCCLPSEAHFHLNEHKTPSHWCYAERNTLASTQNE